MVALKATGTSVLKVVGTLVALKATVDKNVNCHCWQDFGSSESYGYSVKKVVEPPESDLMDPHLADPHFSQCDGSTCEVEQCDALCGRPKSDGNVNYESYESYGCVAVDRE